MELILLGILSAATIIFGPIIVSIIAISKTSSLEAKIKRLERGYAMLLQKDEEASKKDYIISKPDKIIQAKDDNAIKQDNAANKNNIGQEYRHEETASHTADAPAISKIFSWAGGMLVVIGAIYTFSYLYQKGHISHAVIISMAELAGIALAAAGLSMKKPGTQTTASALCAAGLSVCYLSAYSAHSFYSLIGTVPAFAAMAITAAASFIISGIKNRQFIAFLALAAACLTPHLLSSGNDKYLFYFTYIFIVNIPAAALSVRKKWDWMLITSLIFTFAAQFGYAADMGSAAKSEGYFWAVCLAYSLAAGISAIFLIIRAKENHCGTPASSSLSAFAAAQIICLSLCLNDGSEFKCFSSAAAITALALVLEYLRKNGIVSILSLLSWGIFYALLPSAHAEPHYSAAAPIAIFAMFYAFPLILRKKFSDGGVQHLCAAAAGLMALLPLYKDFAKPYFPGMAGLLPLALSLLYILPAFLYFRNKENNARNYEIYSGTAAILLAAGIAMQMSGKWLTAMLAMYASMLCRLDSTMRSRSFIPLAKALFIIASARLLMFAASPDYFSQETKIINGCLLAYGITSGSMIIAAKCFLPGRPEFRKTLYAAAAVLLFLLANIEIADFFAKDGHLKFNFCGKFAEAVAYTLAWAIYGAAACAISIHSKSGALRKFGIIAIAAALAKFGFIDLWKLETIYRIFGAFGMAALLIGTAWIFQRQNRQ